jgi:DNA-binding LacI/PurR family transcriptional regulator
MGITIKDIAQLANVSKTSVSFAFNNPDRISVETYEKIMAIARENGYSPNPVARILNKKQTKSIGMVLPQSVSVFFKNPYLSELLRGVGTICDQQGFSIAIFSPFKGLITQTIMDAAVDGIILLGVSNSTEVSKTLRNRNMPYVTIDADPQDDCVNVGIKEEEMAEELMSLLLKDGHRRIDVCSLQAISPDLEKQDISSTLSLRLKGIHKAQEKFGLTDDEKSQMHLININAVLKEAYESALENLRSADRPTAVFCMADIQAYGFYRAARECSLSIPKDLSVVSFDDIPLSETLFPGLTAVHQSGYDKGKHAANLLFNLINGIKCESEVIETKIINRNSISHI